MTKVIARSKITIHNIGNVTMLITHTKPVFIATRTDGLREYKFTLSGLVEATCIIFCCDIKEAVTHAKKLIQAYIKRMELASKLSEKDKYTTPNTEPANLNSGWYGIRWDRKRRRWRVSVRIDKKDINIGSYKAKSVAVTAKKKANIKYDLPEYHGRR